MGCPFLDESGNRIWKTYEDVDGNSDIFDDIGKEIDRSGEVIVGTLRSGFLTPLIPETGRIGLAQCRLVSIKAVVDIAIAFLREHNSQ